LEDLRRVDVANSAKKEWRWPARWKQQQMAADSKDACMQKKKKY
jgi:hypothetical protein